jgi:hypothetical protein
MTYLGARLPWRSRRRPSQASGTAISGWMTAQVSGEIYLSHDDLVSWDKP